jgi:archaellum biogenesis protein FlaJ (TadC family)
MALSQLKKTVRRLGQHVADKLRNVWNSRPGRQSPPPKEPSKWKPELLAYRLLGRRTARVLPLFRDMDVGLQKSGLRISFKPYVSLTLLTGIIVAASTMMILVLVSDLVLGIALLPSLLFGLGGSLMAGVGAILGFYGYPLYRADARRRDLEDNMAFATGYLAILAGAGVPPDGMFQSLSKIPQESAVVDAAKLIVRDVELFGADVITALESASRRTPSARFKELLEGLVATIHSGGNLVTYLLHRSRQNMRLKRIALRKFSDTLGLLSESYVALLVAGPLIFVVMLAVMAMLGGSTLGGLDPAVLLMLLTYIGIPTGSLIFLLALDALTPRW